MSAELRDAGVEVVDAAVSEAWKRDADLAIDELAKSGNSFTAEDLRSMVGDPPNHPNAMGARFLKAAKRGLIIRVGYRQSQRESLHLHPIAVWKGA